MRRASYYNKHPLNLIRLLGPNDAPIPPEDLLPRLVRDRTPGFMLCEEHREGVTRRLLAARLGEGAPADWVWCLPEVLCTRLVPQTGKNVLYVPDVLAALSACTPPALVFEDGDALYTARPIHDPVACRGLQEALAGCTLEPTGSGPLPPAGSAVLIRFEKAACGFAAGLVMDGPAAP